MCYKTNYEPYRSQSLEELSSEELLYPLGDLYPHVVALQLQSEENPWTKSKNFSGYEDISYWAEDSSSRAPSETSSKHTTCRYNSDLFPAYGDSSAEMSCADALKRHELVS
ncbi:hypothetical protein BDV29DRAFT_153645 [Aspergillus leporis]|uniref:Uncharacterized protein n=1 Tax=Aspergillus leporis TaxID=41062 RepID=A0A5N5XA10_9EURO|nr:hypothetical protein BDV29DRAFT_153645 [Aspergillus leporis]